MIRSLLSAAYVLSLIASTQALVFKSEDKEANFDDRSSKSAAFQVNSVGTYNGLLWNGFSVDEPRQAPGEQEYTGVEVHSEPNYIGAPVDVFSGLPSITTNYEGSNVAFADFERFWWGCSTAEEGTNQQVPGWCTLEVYGYAHDLQEAVTKAISFYFPKDNVRSMPMVETVLPSTFKALSRIEFNVLATKPILYLDNVSYKIYNVTDMNGGIGEVRHAQEASQSEFHMQITGGEQFKDTRPLL